MYQHQISTRAQVYYFFCRIFHSAAMGTHGEQTMVWRICIFLIKPNKESFDLCGGTLSSQVRRLRARMYTALRPKVGRNSGQNPFRVNPWIITHVGQSLPNELGQKGRGEKRNRISTHETHFFIELNRHSVAKDRGVVLDLLNPGPKKRRAGHRHRFNNIICM